MFYIPRNAVFRRVNRRRFLELGGSAATALGAGSIAVGLSSTITRSPVYAASSDDAKWKQYSALKIRSPITIKSKPTFIQKFINNIKT